jgi:catechol 2,3-dioxygenase-like lactoylglutathione lyase family enzyme
MSTASDGVHLISRRFAMTTGAHAVRFGRVAPTIPVTNILTAVLFYTQKLGFKKIFENGKPVGFVILKKDDAEIHLTLKPNHHASDRNVLHLLVSDAQVLYQALDEAGVHIVKGMRDAEYGLRDFVIADPDGNRLDIGQIL